MEQEFLKMENLIYLQQKYLVPTYAKRNLVFERGEGVFLITPKKEKYLDLATNYGVNIFGYNFKPLNKALIEQLKKLPNLHCSFVNEKRVLASKKLIEKCKFEKAQVYWANSGAEAVEAAIKFAILATGKTKFLACKNSYHGKTLGALSLTFSEKYRKDFEKVLFEVDFVEFGNSEDLKKKIKKDFAGFIVEPIQGESGVILPPKGYLKKAKEMCERNGVLIIFDEIQTGCARTGSFLTCFQENVLPDILCLGKGLAGGLPIGATICNEKVFPKIKKFSHTSTFGGNPLCLAGVLKTLELLNDKLQSKIRNLGEYFLENLKKIKSKKIKEIRGRGLMIGVEVFEKRDEILKKLQEEKIIALPAGENVIRFLPPYVITKKQIDFAIKKLCAAF